MRSSPQDRAKTRRWAQVGGPFLMLGVIAALEILSRGVLRIPNPPAFLLLIVVSSSFIGGVGPGLVTTLIAWLYFSYSFSIPGHPLQYTAENLRRVIVWGLTTPVMAILVGVLQRRSERTSTIARERAALIEQIAARDRAERALRDSESRYRSLFEGVPVGLIRTAPVGTILDANPAMAEMFGFPTREALMTVNINELHVDPEERQRVRAHLENGGSLSGVELQMRRNDGSSMWVRVNSRVTHDASGGVLYYDSVALDITERRRAEETKQQLAAIVESSDDAIIGRTLDGVILSWNAGAERIFGYAAEEVIGRHVSFLVPPDHADELSGILEHLKRGERIDHYETVRVCSDGTRLDVSLTISPIKDVAGTLLGVSTIARDITRSKQSEMEIQALNQELEDRVRQRTAQLETINRELETFVYSAAHDLRSPLITMSGLSQMLLEEHALSLPDEAQQYLREIDHNTQKMGMLIDDLLAFSQVGRQPMTKQPVALADVARQVLAALNGSDGGRAATVRIGDLPPCQADPALLKQVLVNLLSNALKFSRGREDPVIEVGWRQDLDHSASHTYFVKDNGAGFDMQYAKKLFHVFQRLHHADEYEGTGIGLAIVQRIIDRHGGRVWAEGELGKGATFYFTLPMSGAA